MSLARSPSSGLCRPWSLSFVSRPSAAAAFSLSVILRFSTFPPWEFLPAGPVPARIYVNERTVPGRGSIQSSPAHELRIGSLHALLGLENHPGVVDIDLPVVVEVVHRTIPVVIDEDVARV